MSKKPQAVLESIVQMTDQRQLDSLAESLVSTVMQMVKVEQVKILAVDPYLDRHAAANQLSLQADVSACHVFHECLKTHAVAQVSTPLGEPKTREQIAIPIMLKDSVVMILWVTSEHLCAQDIQMLIGFSKVYENFQSMVIESETDPLTGLLNRKAFLPRLMKVTQALRKAAIDGVIEPEKYQPSLQSHWLCIFDIDKFKLINDTFGHLYGDEILLDMVKVMKATFNEHDSIFRFGGDEFVVLMSKRTKADMLTLCEDFSHKLSINHGREVNVTISMGIIEVNSVEEPSELLIKADKALYHIKETGRNRVGLYEDLVADGSIIPLTIEDDIELF
ncbi:GGDEF domain-containing protein [Shewanella sp. VB17]|uniref:GGDEF domain-containing protein n=1 Tax=Shewanella sp. VB17 TaxID=2739432 RepID=UPI001564A547|nr:GGDEF domain-containing protein [Shewanella sp. VB17]NRD75193.1 GGDEF domain-containing protein [Shewanella sp. VB17]